MADMNPRARSALANDDKDLIERMSEAPSHGGRSGGNLQRDVATRADEGRIEDPDGSTARVQGSDKPEGANRPRFNPR